MDLVDEDCDGEVYFPELTWPNFKLKSKYGILNVGLVKNNKVITGYQWNYRYWTGEDIKIIHSYDLRILREKVEMLGFDWIITDNRTAIDTYKLNNEFLRKRSEYIKQYGERGRKTSTGVKYVSKQKSDNYKKGFCWLYSVKQNDVSINITSVDLLKLKKRVEDKGLEWNVFNDDLYQKSLEENANDI